MWGNLERTILNIADLYWQHNNVWPYISYISKPYFMETHPWIWYIIEMIFKDFILFLKDNNNNSKFGFKNKTLLKQALFIIMKNSNTNKVWENKARELCWNWQSGIKFNYYLNGVLLCELRQTMPGTIIEMGREVK